METNKGIGVTLVTQSFGKESEYKRAIFMIWSFWAHTRQFSDVILFTDAPEYFSPYFRDKPVHFELLTAEKIVQMRGEIDFLHRMKIALIERAFHLIKGNMLYVDSDTFFTNDIRPLYHEVSPDKAYMHLLEYDFESMRNVPLPAGASFRKFLALIESQVFHLSNDKSLHVNTKQNSWNAGAMLLHYNHARLLNDVYALTDQIYPVTQNHASEQYAFSIILENNTLLQPLDTYIFHYWHRVKKGVMDLFLRKRISMDWAQKSDQQKTEAIMKMTKQLPGHFNSHYLSDVDAAIQAFNERRYKIAYRYSLKALSKKPWNVTFIKDILYHTKKAVLSDFSTER
jgi:hypothetical protein